MLSRLSCYQFYREVLRAVEAGCGKRNRCSTDFERICQAYQHLQGFLCKDPGQEYAKTHMYAAIERHVHIIFACDIKVRYLHHAFISVALTF